MYFRPDGIVLPKVDEAEQIEWVNQKIEAAELAMGWPLQSIRLLAGVETPKGILNLKGNRFATTPGGADLWWRGLRGQRGRHPHPGAEELLYAARGGGGLQSLWLASH